MKLTIYSVLFALAAAAGVSAQEGSHLTFQVGAGFTDGVGRTGSYLDSGWNISYGVGYNFNPYLGALIDISDNGLGINSATLTRIGGSGGDVNLFTATLDPIVHLNPHGHVDVYITGGGGLFHQKQAFSSDPFFDLSPAAIPSTQIPGSYSTNRPGIDGGVGIAIGTKWHGKLFAEARYDRMFYSSNFHTDYLPVTFGYRW